MAIEDYLQQDPELDQLALDTPSQAPAGFAGVPALPPLPPRRFAEPSWVPVGLPQLAPMVSPQMGSPRAAFGAAPNPLDVAPPPEPTERGLFGPALASGWEQAKGLVGSTASLVGQLGGFEGLKSWGDQYAAEKEQAAQDVGRPDIVTPWREGGKGLAGVPEWALYTATQSLPVTAGLLAAGLVGSKALAGTGLAVGAGRALTMLPSSLGGTAGMAAPEAARRGAQFVGFQTAGTPVAAASIFSEAQKREREGGDPTSTEDVTKALAFAPLYAGLETLGLGAFISSFNKGARSRPMAILAGSIRNAGAEAVTEAPQRLMELSVRPDMPVQKKLEEVVDAFAGGFATGGIYGATGGALSRTKRIDPNTPPEQLATIVDTALQPPLGTQGELLSPTDVRSTRDPQSQAMDPYFRAPTYPNQPPPGLPPSNRLEQPGQPDFLQTSGAEVGSQAYGRLSDQYRAQQRAIVEQALDPQGRNSLPRYFDFVNQDKEPRKQVASLQAAILRRLDEQGPEETLAFVQAQLARAGKKKPELKQTLEGAQKRIQAVLNASPQMRQDDLIGMMEPMAPRLPLGYTQYESPVGPLDARELERLQQLDAEGRLNPAQRDFAARESLRMKRVQGQELNAPPLEGQVQAAPAPAPELPPAPARPAAFVAPEPAPAAPLSRADLEFLRSRNAATPGQLEQLAQIERLETLRPAEAPLDARQTAELLRRDAAGTINPAEAMLLARQLAAFRAQGQAVPDVPGVPQPEVSQFGPQVQNMPEFLAGREQLAPPPPVMTTPVDDLIQQVLSGQRLTPAQENQVNAALARQAAARTQAGAVDAEVSTQQDLLDNTATDLLSQVVQRANVQALVDRARTGERLTPTEQTLVDNELARRAQPGAEGLVTPADVAAARQLDLQERTNFFAQQARQRPATPGADVRLPVPDNATEQQMRERDAQDVAQEQAAVAAAQREAAFADTEAARAGRQAQKIAEARFSALDRIVNDPRVQNKADAFQAVLNRSKPLRTLGDTPTQQELATLARFADVRTTLAPTQAELKAAEAVARQAMIPSRNDEFVVYERRGNEAQQRRARQEAKLAVVRAGREYMDVRDDPKALRDWALTQIDDRRRTPNGVASQILRRLGYLRQDNGLPSRRAEAARAAQEAEQAQAQAQEEMLPPVPREQTQPTPAAPEPQLPRVMPMAPDEDAPSFVRADVVIGEPDAVQEQSTARVDVPESAQTGRQVPGGNAQGNAAARQGKQPRQPRQGQQPREGRQPREGARAEGRQPQARNEGQNAANEAEVTARPAPTTPRRAALSQAQQDRADLRTVADTLTKTELARFGGRIDMATVTAADIKAGPYSLQDLADSLTTKKAPVTVETLRARAEQARKKGTSRARALSPVENEAYQNENGYSREQADAIVRSLMRGAKNPPTVLVVDTRDSDDIAQTIRDYDNTQTSRYGAKALGHYIPSSTGNKAIIVVMANRHATPESVQATLFHEMLGHYGLEQAFGAARTEMFTDIFNKTPRIQQEMASTAYANESAEIQAEEWLVSNLEGGRVPATMFQRIVNMIRSFARQMGILKGAYSRSEIAVILDRASEAVTEGRGLAAPTNTAQAVLPMARLPFSSINDMTQGIVGAAMRIAPSKISLRETALGWATTNAIDELYARDFSKGGLNAVKRAQDVRNAVASRLINSALQPMEQLSKADAQTAELITEKIVPAAAFRLDVTKSWADNKHVLTGDADVDGRLRDVHRVGYDSYNRLRREGKNKVYDDLVTYNQMDLYARQSQLMWDAVQNDPAIDAKFKASLTNVLEAYQTARGVTNDVTASRDWFKAQQEKMTAAIEKYLKDQGKQQAKKTTTIAAMMAQLKEQRRTNELYPYFHLGRFGDFAVSFEAVLKNGKIDPKAEQEIARRFQEAGISGVEVGGDPRMPRYYIKVNSEVEQIKLFEVAKKLQSDNLVNKALAFKTADQQYGGPQAEVVTQLIEAARTGFATEAELDAMPKAQAEAVRDAQKAAIDNLRRAYLDLLPDTSVARVLVYRENVRGYSQDFMRSYAFRAAVGARALANQYASSREAAGFKQMRDEIKEVSRSDPARANRMQQVMTEMEQRKANQGSIDKETWHDLVRAVNSVYFLALNPAYVATNILQVPMFAVPYMGKIQGIGYFKALNAVRKTLPLALAIAREAFKEGRAISGARAGNALVSDSAMVEAGANEGQIDTIIKGILANGIDSGAASREINRLSEARTGTKINNLVTMASSFGYYSELVSRLNVALAAHELGLGDRVGEILNGSMFQYAESNTARQLGRAGVAGQLTPVTFAFYQYPAQAMERLAIDYYTGYRDAGATPQEQAEARRFLKYTLASMMTLGGTLGLPFIYAVAGVLSALKDAFDGDDEVTDLRRSWRNLLTDVFGETVGDIAARGITRSFNVDISERVGLAGAFPFTKLLTDRREWKDAAGDWAKEMFGSPFGMGLNILQGSEKVMKGDLLGAGEVMLPTTLKNLVKAYKMGTEGWKDQAGRDLPITPEMDDIVIQALGFTPGVRAEYNEKKLYADTERGVLRREAKDIRTNLAKAIEDNKPDDVRKYVERAQRFDRTNPAFAVLPGMPGTLRRRAQDELEARFTGTLGLSFKQYLGGTTGGRF